MPAAGTAWRSSMQDVRQDLEVGLLTPTAAREIARLPAGNQSEVVDVIAAGGTQRRRACRRGPHAPGVGDRRAEDVRAGQATSRHWGRPARRSQKAGIPGSARRGNRVGKQLAVLLDRLAGMENFLDRHGWTSLTAAIAWSWDRSSSGSHAMRTASRTGPMTSPWRCGGQA